MKTEERDGPPIVACITDGEMLSLTQAELDRLLRAGLIDQCPACREDGFYYHLAAGATWTDVSRVTEAAP